MRHSQPLKGDKHLSKLKHILTSGTIYLSESIVLAILKASVTGAGLVLAFYSLIIPILKRLSGFTAIERKEGILRSQRLVESASPEPTDEELGEIAEAFRSVPARKVPFHMGYGIIITFIGFISSGLMTISWIKQINLDFVNENLINIFGTTIFIFGLMGIFIMKDIFKILKAEYETRPIGQEPGDELNVISEP